jgi:hypothetical protein
MRQRGGSGILIENGKLNIKELQKLLTQLSSNESKELLQIVRSSTLPIFSDVYEVGKKGAKIFSPQKFGNAIAKSVTSSFDMDQVTLIQSFMDSQYHEDLFRRERDYFQMLQWNFLYYNSGKSAINIRMYYPHSTAPLLVELLDFITNGDNVSSQAYCSLSRVDFGMLEQMVASIPVSFYKDNVPSHLYPLYDEISPIYDMTGVETYHKDIHGNVLVPPIDMMRIICCVSSLGEINDPFYEGRSEPMCLVLSSDKADIYTRYAERKGFKKSLDSTFPIRKNKKEINTPTAGKIIYKSSSSRDGGSSFSSRGGSSSSRGGKKFRK